jgi:GH25 family lysozyme M1 (1,4-beta-N-acetylmuramidase)
MDPIVGIDISEYQWRAGIPFGMLPRLNARGVRFLIARATIGTRPDPSFAPNRHRGTFRSWVPGGYHYLVDSIDPLAQEDAFSDECRRTGGIDGLLTALDVEDDNRGPILNRVKLRDVAAWAKRWKDNHPLHQLILYTNLATWGRLGNPDAESLGFDLLWQARWYVDNERELPERPPHGFGGMRSPLWQWGSFDIKSQSGNMLHLDGNAWYGTLDGLREVAAVERKPLEDRPAYREAYNAQVAAALAALGGLTPATGKPAVVAGSTDALSAAIAAVEEQKLGR